jgi:hypothetical protein
MKKIVKTGIILLSGGILLIVVIAGILIARTWGKAVIQVDIRQNMDIIHLSTFGEPPQFAIWLEDPATQDLVTVFVTHRVATGDWEGKADVPVALPQWSRLFTGESGSAGRSDLIITGATPKEDFFSVRAEVRPNSEWICWIEMNLAGDFNEAFPEFDIDNFYEDEFSRGQPSLLYRAEIKAVEDMVFTPVLTAQSVLSNGDVRVEPVSEGVTTARYVFDTILISISRPKAKLIDKNRIEGY